MAEDALSLLRDSEKWRHFSREARRRAAEEFETGAIVARYRALYEETLAGEADADRHR